MPLFSYLIVQGFFYTKSRKKYIIKLFVLANITQLFLLILGYFNYVCKPDYYRSVNDYFNIIYSYVICLCTLSIFEKKTLIRKISKLNNNILKTIVIMCILSVYLFVNIEFDFSVPIIILGIYFIEKLLSENNNLILSYDKRIISKKKILYYTFLFCIGLISCTFFTFECGNKYVMVLYVFIIMLYNGEKGKNNLFVQRLFYSFYSIQHIILYMIALLIY